MSFSDDLLRFAEKVEGEADRRVRAACLQLTQGVIQRTPVATGRLRANWQASIDAPIEQPTEDTDKSGGPTLSKAQAAIKQATGRVFYLTNNLPYAPVIEFGQYGEGPKTEGGYSRQAPRGMARITVEELRRALSR